MTAPRTEWALTYLVCAQHCQDDAVIVQHTPTYKESSLLCCLLLQLQQHKIITGNTPEL